MKTNALKARGGVFIRRPGRSYPLACCLAAAVVCALLAGCTITRHGAEVIGLVPTVGMTLQFPVPPPIPLPAVAPLPGRLPTP